MGWSFCLVGIDVVGMTSRRTADAKSEVIVKSEEVMLWASFAVFADCADSAKPSAYRASDRLIQSNQLHIYTNKTE